MNHMQVLVILQHQTCKLITVNPTAMTAGEHSIRKLNKIYREFFKLILQISSQSLGNTDK